MEKCNFLSIVISFVRIISLLAYLLFRLALSESQFKKKLAVGDVIKSYLLTLIETSINMPLEMDRQIRRLKSLFVIIHF